MISTFAHVALIAFTTVQVRAQYAQYSDVNDSGSIISTTNQPSVAACQSACQADSNCQTFGVSYLQNSVDCSLISAATAGNTLSKTNHFSSGLRGTCQDFSTTASALAQSLCTVQNAFAVFSNFDLPNIGDYMNSNVATTQDCQQACNDDPTCLAYTAVDPLAGDSGSVACYLKNIAPAQDLAGHGFDVFAFGDCADASTLNNVQCQNSPAQQEPIRLAPSPAARFRNRRSVELKSIRSICPVKTESACSIVKKDGTLALGHECVDLQTDVDNCGACNVSCSATQQPGVYFSGCHDGHCHALKCRAGYRPSEHTHEGLCIPVLNNKL